MRSHRTGVLAVFVALASCGAPARAVTVPSVEPKESIAAKLDPGGPWNCPFPHEADQGDILEGVAVLQVLVREDGSVVSVDVLKESSPGFGKQARACAATHTYLPGVDGEGRPTVAKTKPFRIHFDRTPETRDEVERFRATGVRRRTN